MPAHLSSDEARGYWDERYRGVDSPHGSEPNASVAQEFAGMAPSRVLDLACGQGRNAVWMAAQGHEVTGIDVSPVAIEEARSRTAALGVAVDLIVADVLDWEPDGEGYDLVLLSYLQLPQDDRIRAHRRARSALKPGGVVFLVAHHADNLEHGYGGPQYSGVLYSGAELTEDFAGMDIVRNERTERIVRVDGNDEIAVDIVFVARA